MAHLKTDLFRHIDAVLTPADELPARYGQVGHNPSTCGLGLLHACADWLRLSHLSFSRQFGCAPLCKTLPLELSPANCRMQHAQLRRRGSSYSVYKDLCNWR